MVSMKHCTVVATFVPKDAELEAVKEFLAEAAKEVRLEDGCLYYDLYQEVNGKLLFIESWRDRQSWEAHNRAESVSRIVEFLQGKLMQPALVQEMYQVEG